MVEQIMLKYPLKHYKLTPPRLCNHYAYTYKNKFEKGYRNAASQDTFTQNGLEVRCWSKHYTSTFFLFENIKKVQLKYIDYFLLIVTGIPYLLNGNN